MKLEQKTKQFIAKYHMLSEGAGVLVGLSGGADSVALLEVLCDLQKELGLRLAALHVHHGIRQEAQADADFCRALCEAKGVEFYWEYAQVPELAAKWGMSLEEAGRKLRYGLFEAYRQKLELDLIAVAHHQNDQAETMLFQLFRGSGLRGLAGMPVQREHIIRPLLGVTREEIEEYLEERHIGYVTDATNLTDIYTRNKLRLHMLPLAEEISAGAAEHMCQAAARLREVLDYMECEARQFLEQYGAWICRDGVSSREWGTAVKAKDSQEEHGLPLKLVLPVAALQKKHPALQKMIIMEAVAHTFGSRKDITERHIETVLQLLNKDGEKVLQLPKGGRVTKCYQELIFEKCRPSKEADEKGAVGGDGNETEAVTSQGQLHTEPQAFSVLPESDFLLPDGRRVKTQLFFDNNLQNIPKSDCVKWFDYDKIEGCLTLRTRKKGDFLCINDNGSRKSLQDYLVNEKVPRSERDKLLVLADGQHIVWVPGMRISAYYKVTQQTKCILQVYIGGEHHGRES